MTARLHGDELPIDVGLVQRLVAGQFPELGARAVRPLTATGSSNRLFRLGDDLLVRMPRQPGGTAAIEKEARWLPFVASHLTISVPEVVAVGEPAEGYPEHWSVVRWIDGEPADRGVRAQDLAELISQLRAMPQPPGALSDPTLTHYRGAPLADFDDDFAETVAACRELSDCGIDLDAATRVWKDIRTATDGVTVERRWFHGDLLGENLLTQGGRLTALLDFGGLAIGDPSVDLVAAWDVLDRRGRVELRAALGGDEVSWLAGAGWALFIATMTLPYYWRTMPERCRTRQRLAAAVIAEL